MRCERAEQALFDIRDNVLLAQEFAADMMVDTPKGNRRTFYAVARCREIISEAARRFTPSHM
jgi:uncharacterized protein with HEPN domain